MADMTSKLVFLNGERAGETIDLADGEVHVLGRSTKQADVVVEDRLVSRAHAEIRVTPDGVLVKDRDSTHGTFLNGKRIRGAVSLAPDDVINLGSVKIRFAVATVPGEQDQDAGEPASAAAVSAASVGDATRFAGGEDRDATRYVEPSQQSGRQDEDESEHTRVIGQDATRFLDVDELGAKPGGEKEIRSRSPLPGIVAVVVILMVSLGYFAMHDKDGAAGRGSPALQVHDSQFGFQLVLPPGWKRWKGAEDALMGFEYKDPDSGKSVARAQVFAKRDPSYVATGVSAGFRDYVNTLRDRFDEFYLQGDMAMRVSGAHVIFFAYGRKGVSAKAIYTLHKDVRLAVVCESPTSRYRDFKAAFTDILQSFALDEDQVYVDFPLATEVMRRRALGDPQGLQEDAEANLKVGEDLLKRGSVRPDNLYRSVQALELCLQQCSAFSQPPTFYRKATETLSYARRQCREAIRTQRYAITRAKKQRDFAEVYWEANKLMQMVPDATDPDYQYAYRLTKRHKEAISKR